MTKSSKQTISAHSSLGIDIGKDVFHLVGFDGDGKIFPRTPGEPATSGPEGNPEEIVAIPDIRRLTSGIGGKLTVRRTCP